MKNKNCTIILSIILAVQFIIPLSIWSYETYKNKELEEKGQEVKLLIDYVDYDEGSIEFQVRELEGSLLLDYSKDFIVFENNNNGFYACKETTEIPDNDLYVSVNSLTRAYRQDYCFKYKSEVTKAQNEYDYYQLFNKNNERRNIASGFCDGSETQAYAVFKIYKNRFEVVNVYIDEIPVDEVIEMYNNNEWDNSRYEYRDKEVEIYDYYDEYYDEELDEYITEPVEV